MWLDDIDPDGVSITIPWDKFEVGDSVFVPCLNTTRCIWQAREQTQKRDFTISTRICVEDGYLGVRIWRTT
jgi:hypothetical protein